MDIKEIFFWGKERERNCPDKSRGEMIGEKRDENVQENVGRLHKDEGQKKAFGRSMFLSAVKQETLADETR